MMPILAQFVHELAKDGFKGVPCSSLYLLGCRCPLYAIDLEQGGRGV